MAPPATDACPTLEILERYAATDAADPNLRAHLDRCPECRARLGEIRENNELFERVAKATGGAGDASAGDGAPGEVPGYDILEEIHRGGQGVVYRAVQRSTKRTVALKMLLQGAFSTSRQRRRFEREIETVAALRHPGIVTVFDSGITPDGRPYYSMELVEGRPLDAAGRAPAPETPPGVRRRERLRVFLGVCEAVAFAHRHAVIHRDLKPSNVIVDTEGRPRVLDFGVAKAIDAPPGADETIAGELMGTLAYAAPEQVSGDPARIDTRCDVYALGVILFEILTGARPFLPHDALAEIIRDITDTPAPAPSTRGGPTDADLDAIALKALEKRPEDRYSSVDALAADVRATLAGEPVEARRDQTWYLVRKIVRRHTWPITIGAGVVLALAIVAVSMSILYRRAQLEARRSNTMRIFLEDTLGSVPDTPDRSETSLRTVLDEAVQWVDIALSDQPEIAVSIRLTIGNSYRSLGLLDKAEAQVSLALEQRRRTRGPRHPDTATCLNALGLVHLDRADTDAAEPLLRQALDIRAARYGQRDLHTAMSHMNLARLERARGRTDDAERELQTCLGIRRARLGDRHPDVAMCTYELAQLAADRSDLERAEALHRDALEIRRRTLPPGHPDLARSHLALGRLLAARGDRAGAESHLGEAAELLRSTFGPEHPAAIEAAETLASFRATAGTHP